MKIRYKKVEVRMQQGAAIASITIPEWELPVLQAVQPEVTELKDVVVEREPLSVSGEMSRLKLAYGAEREEGGITGLTFAESVYGQHAQGNARLKEAMQAAVLPASTPVTPIEMAPEIRQDLLKELSSDSGFDDLIGETEAEDDTINA